MNGDEITVRRTTDSDARDLLMVHFDAVRNIASADYPEEITTQWSRRVDQGRIVEFLGNPDNEIRLVAEVNGEIVGFGAIVPETEELRACYVSSKAKRRRVGTALVTAIEKIAREKGCEYLWLDSSVTAEKFYLSCGYRIVERGKHVLRDDITMDCIAMRKDLSD